VPSYDYQCKAGHVTESHQLMAEKAAHIRCHTCGKRARPVILKAPAAIVKNPAVPRSRNGR
jgi:putative FmdB family regulatory protein